MAQGTGRPRSASGGGPLGVPTAGCSSTRPGASLMGPRANETSTFGAETMVRVTRVRSQGVLSDRPGTMGQGRLVVALCVGQALRVQLDQEDSPALVTSPVRGMERIGPGVVQVVTQNSVYRLEASCSAESGEAPAARSTVSSPACPPERLARLRQEARLRMRAMQDRVRREGGGVLRPVGVPSRPAAGNPDDATGFVLLPDLPTPSRALFAVGTRILVAQRKLADPTADYEDAGTGRVLGPLEAGEPARLSIDGGPTFVTSPVQRLRLIDARCIELETANTLYRIARL